MKTFAKKPLALLIATAFLAACSSTEPLVTPEEIEDEQQKIEDRVASEFDLNTRELAAKPYTYSKTIDILGGAFEMVEEQPLPPAFDDEMHFDRVDEIDLDTLIEKINKKYQKYGIVVNISDDARSYINSSFETASSTNDITSNDDSTGIINITSLDTGALEEHATTKGYSTKFSLSSGSLRSTMDILTANTNTWWRYEDGRVTIYRTEPVTFMVDANGKTYQASFTQSATAGSTENSSGSNWSATSTGTNPLDEIRDQLKIFLSDSGKVYVNKQDSTVTIKDTPPVVKRVKKFLKDYNYRATTSYAINVDVFEIITEVNENQNLDWEVMFETATTSFGFNAPSILRDASSGSLEASVVKGNWNTEAALELLHKNASIFSYISKKSKTKNGVPTIISSIDDQGIVSGRSVTVSADGFSQEEIQTKLVDEGFSITATPKITSMGRIDLDVTVNTKVIKNIETVGTEEEQLQLEETKKQGNSAVLLMRDGDTTIVSAYERFLTSADVKSLAKDYPWWAGGGQRGTRYKSNLIIVAQPTILER